jgi:hypothetical protein
MHPRHRPESAFHEPEEICVCGKSVQYKRIPRFSPVESAHQGVARQVSDVFLSLRIRRAAPHPPVNSPNSHQESLLLFRSQPRMDLAAVAFSSAPDLITHFPTTAVIYEPPLGTAARVRVCLPLPFHSRRRRMKATGVANQNLTRPLGPCPSANCRNSAISPGKLSAEILPQCPPRPSVRSLQRQRGACADGARPERASTRHYACEETVRGSSTDSTILPVSCQPRTFVSAA